MCCSFKLITGKWFFGIYFDLRTCCFHENYLIEMIFKNMFGFILFSVFVNLKIGTKRLSFIAWGEIISILNKAMILKGLRLCWQNLCQIFKWNWNNFSCIHFIWVVILTSLYGWRVERRSLKCCIENLGYARLDVSSKLSSKIIKIQISVT